MTTTKSCYDCKWLEYISADDNAEGYVCNGRDYRNYSEEDNHLGLLENESYLCKGKSCCEMKE